MKRILRTGGAILAGAAIVVGDLTSGRLSAAVVDAVLLACIYLALLPLTTKSAA